MCTVTWQLQPTGGYEVGFSRDDQRRRALAEPPALRPAEDTTARASWSPPPTFSSPTSPSPTSSPWSRSRRPSACAERSVVILTTHVQGSTRIENRATQGATKPRLPLRFVFMSGHSLAHRRGSLPESSACDFCAFGGEIFDREGSRPAGATPAQPAAAPPALLDLKAERKLAAT